MNNGAKYSMGTGNRISAVNKSHADLPAPGSYDLSMIDKQNNPRFGFGTSKRGAGDKLEKNPHAPGPGQYSLKNLLGTEGKSYSIHNKLNYKPIENTGGLTPGPGSYD